jgi:hypothetical protein
MFRRGKKTQLPAGLDVDHSAGSTVVLDSPSH